MSKAGKRAKSGLLAPSNPKWELALQSIPLEEDSWKPNVSLIVGNKVDDYKHIDVLTATVNSGVRRLFSSITKDALFNEAKDLGNTKNKKAKDVPANFEVCEPVRAHLEAGEDVPLPLLAKLIKFKLLALKTTDQKRRDAEKKEAADKKAAKAKGDTKNDRAKSPGKKGGKKTPEGQAAKEGSKLKKRGEDDSRTKFIDDEPDDGAKYYFFLIGFNNPHLLHFLADVGIFTNSVICITSQDYSRSAHPPVDAHATEKDEKALAAEDLIKAERYRLAVELKTFWKDITPLLRSNPDSSRLHDVAKLDYEVKSLIVPAGFEDPESKNQFGLTMFEDLACMIYDLQDAKRLYHTYLQNLKLIPVPTATEKPQEKPAAEGQSIGAPATPVAAAVAPINSGSVMELSQSEAASPPDMRYYNDLMNAIPHESVSVALVLHCIVEQVVATEENRDPPSEQAPALRLDGLNRLVADHLSNTAFKLALSADEHEKLSEILELPQRPPEEPRPPLLINAHDDISIRTHHLKALYDVHPEKVERQMLERLPLSRNCQPQRPTSAECRARAARLQELIHFCATNGLSPSEIDRAFKLFVFESMDLASTDPNGFLLTVNVEGLHKSSIPWDDPYPFFKGMIPHEGKISVIDIVESSEDSDQSGVKSPAATEDTQTHSLRTDDSQTSEIHLSQSQHTPRSISRASSADSKKGILRSRSNTPARSRSRSNSYVKFEVPVEHSTEMEVVEPEPEPEPEKSTEENLMEVVNAQKRVLDQWCFAEHYEPGILLQVLRDAQYNLPYVETYSHRRDQSVMLVLHHPYNSEFQSHIDWHTELHSNAGFRNYLENTAESLADWLKEKEAEHQAHLLSAEVEKMHNEDQESTKGEKKGKGGKGSPRKSARSKSPKAASSRSGSLDSMPNQANPYIRPNSLKAMKEEQERLAKEELEKENEKKDKKKSAKKTKEEKEDEKKPPSRSGSKTKMSALKLADEAPAAQHQTVKKEEEKFWPFTGYDTGNLLLHVSGITTSLFPSDGGQIRSERTEFVQGTTAVRTTVLKDGHSFSVHVINPKDNQEEPYDPDLEVPKPRNTEEHEKAELEKSEKEEKQSREDKTRKVKPVSQFGSLTATLADGMVLSFSQFGPTGETPESKPYEPAPYVPPVQAPSPAPAAPSPSKAKKEKGGKSAATPEPTVIQPEDEAVPEEGKEEAGPPPAQPFLQVYVTCPDGLHIRYFLQSSVGVIPANGDDRHLVVKQSYPFKTSCAQDCEASRRKYIQAENSRIMTADGTVIKNMADGSVEVLYADSMVATFTGYWPNHSSRSSSPQHASSARSQAVVEQRTETPTKKMSRSAKGNKGGDNKQEKVPLITEASLDLTQASEDEQQKPGFWTVTYPNGERVKSLSGAPPEVLKPVMICVASDPDTRQTMATRDDKVMMVSYPDGTTVVEHSDGTRITVYYRDTQVPVGNDADNGEPVDVITQTLKFVKIECPAYATVEFNCATSESLTVFGSGSSVNVFPDGYYILHHSRGGRVEIDTEGTMVYYPRPIKTMEQLLPERELQYVLRHNADVIVETVDPDGNVFNVKSSGDFCVMPSNADDMSENSDEAHAQGEKKMVRYGLHSPRFFIVHADGSGTELLRYQDIAEYLLAAERNPATAVLKEPLPDYPGVVGMTILKPYVGGLSQRWFKSYDQPSIIPAGIRSRDLTTLPAKEYKKPGPRFGTNVGQGLSVAAAIKTQSRVAILKCPPALELRQFVQYKPVTEDLRERLCSGLKAYAEYVMERNRLDELIAIQDPRSDKEKMLAADLLAAAMTQHPDPIEPDFIKEMYETAIAPPPPSPPPTPQPKRTQADWERDQRELAEEAEGLAMLKGKKIPPYFASEMGKAFLLTQAKDMDELLKQLSEDPRRDGTEAIRAYTGQSRDIESSSFPASRQLYSQPGMSGMSGHSTSGSDSPRTMARSKLPPETPSSFVGRGVSEMSGATPNGARPVNPTPAQAACQCSPTPVRPKNPTPATAGKAVAERPLNHTPKMARGYAETPSEFETLGRGEYPMIPEHPVEEEWGGMEGTETATNMMVSPSLKVNVAGEPRVQPVPLPTSIMGGRPNARANQRYAEVEDPVRRHIRNTVAAGVTWQGASQLRQMQGLIVVPEEVNFGVLREGSTYACMVHLKNTGVDACRFRIKQPPPATGLRVIYKPGPVAAGMQADLRLELYAIAVGVEGESGVGTISHALEVTTEVDILCIPVQATVMTAYEFDNSLPASSPRARHSPGVVLVSNKPPATTGIIRPRKELAAGGP